MPCVGYADYTVCFVVTQFRDIFLLKSAIQCDPVMYRTVLDVYARDQIPRNNKWSIGFIMYIDNIGLPGKHWLAIYFGYTEHWKTIRQLCKYPRILQFEVKFTLRIDIPMYVDTIVCIIY